MAVGCLFVTFAVTLCALIGLANRALNLDVIGPVGVALVVVALIAAAALARQVWRRPEGFVPPPDS